MARLHVTLPALLLPLPIPLLSAPVAHSARIDNNSIWRDSEGLEIKAQGGCILEDGKVFHWIGPAFEAGDFHFRAINHYTSADLQTWKKQPPILAPDMPGLAAVPITSTSWVGRPWVMKRAAGAYVMWIEAGKLTGSVTRYRTASRIGPASAWSALKEAKLLPADDAYSFRAQHDFVLPVTGTETTTYVYCGDRWSLYGGTDYDGAVGRQAWFPLSFDANGAPTLNAPGFGATLRPRGNPYEQTFSALAPTRTGYPGPFRLGLFRLGVFHRLRTRR